jgi:hypothetical protein
MRDFFSLSLSLTFDYEHAAEQPDKLKHAAEQPDKLKHDVIDSASL